MPLQSVELVLDAATDEAVRGLWQALSDVGLPSQADHRGPTNAPHVTLAAVPVVTDAAEEALVPFAARLPLPLEVAGPMLLGERRPALVLPVRPGGELDRLHANVESALAEDRAGIAEGVLTVQRPVQAEGVGAAGGADGVDVGAAQQPWVPHVTLARRLRPEVCEAALALLQSLTLPRTATAVALRRWDPEGRRAWLVG